MLVVEKIGVSAVVAAADAATKLIELGQAERIGAVDDDGIHVRDVDARLDDGGADEHIVLVLDEGEHNLLQLALVHLAVPDDDPRLRHDLLQLSNDLLNAAHPVVDVVDLSSPADLAQNGFTNVRIGVRSRGGVLIIERSRMPLNAMCNVRGIGVAVIVSTSTVARA